MKPYTTRGGPLDPASERVVKQAFKKQAQKDKQNGRKKA